MIIPSGSTTWQSDPNSSPTSPARSKTTPAKVTPRQSGHHRGVIRAPPLSAKLQCGARPTASIPKIRDQPEEEATSKRARPSGNKPSTGISPVPPIRQATRGLTNYRQHTPHPDAGTTSSARTKNLNGVRTGRPRPADDTPQSSDRGPTAPPWKRAAGLAPDCSGHSAGRSSRVPEPIWTRSGGSDQSRQTTPVPTDRRA